MRRRASAPVEDVRLASPWRRWLYVCTDWRFEIWRRTPATSRLELPPWALVKQEGSRQIFMASPSAGIVLGESLNQFTK
jgi:hypothetical protein